MGVFCEFGARFGFGSPLPTASPARRTLVVIGARFGLRHLVILVVVVATSSSPNPVASVDGSEDRLAKVLTDVALEFVTRGAGDIDREAERGPAFVRRFRVVVVVRSRRAVLALAGARGAVGAGRDELGREALMTPGGMDVASSRSERRMSLRARVTFLGVWDETVSNTTAKMRDKSWSAWSRSQTRTIDLTLASESTT